MKKGLTPYGVGSFFIPSATFLLSGRLQSMCDIVLGAEIERALRAVQRDEGWNCKGALRQRGKRKPLTLPHNTTSRAFTTRGRLSCQPPHLHYSTIQPAQQGRSGKEKSNPAQKGLFRRYAEAFSEDFFQWLLAFWTFLPFPEDFQTQKTTRLLSNQIREKWDVHSISFPIQVM